MKQFFRRDHGGRPTFAGVAALALALAFSTAAPAQSNMAEIARYGGADRMERLIAGAQQEGSLTIYTSAPVEDMTALTQAFTAKYGIPVEIWRGSSEDVLQRGVAETNAGRFAVDIFETNGPELEALTREEITQVVDSPTFKELSPRALLEHRGWVGTRFNIIAQSYNTNLVKAEELPKEWAGFLDPKWKGKLGVEADNFDWFGAIVQSFPTEQEGLDFFRKLVATNGISVRKGHTLLINLTASGEVPLSFTVYQYKAEQLKRDKAPLDWFNMPPAEARLNGIAVARNAPHPNAAVLFYEFAISDAQALLAERGFTPTNVSRYPLPEGLEINVIDSAIVLDEGKKWRDLFDEIVLTQK